MKTIVDIVINIALMIIIDAIIFRKYDIEAAKFMKHEWTSYIVKHRKNIYS